MWVHRRGSIRSAAVDPYLANGSEIWGTQDLLMTSLIHLGFCKGIGLLAFGGRLDALALPRQRIGKASVCLRIVWVVTDSVAILGDCIVELAALQESLCSVAGNFGSLPIHICPH